MSKSLSEDREDLRPIKEDDDTDVGATSIESFCDEHLGMGYGRQHGESARRK